MENATYQNDNRGFVFVLFGVSGFFMVLGIVGFIKALLEHNPGNAFLACFFFFGGAAFLVKNLLTTRSVNFDDGGITVVSFLASKRVSWDMLASLTETMEKDIYKKGILTYDTSRSYRFTLNCRNGEKIPVSTFSSKKFRTAMRENVFAKGIRIDDEQTEIVHRK